MRKAVAGSLTLAAFCGLALSTAFAQAGGAELNGVPLDGLSASQKAAVMKLAQDRDCSCGCGMKVAECRVKDPGCSYSKGLATTIANAIRAGKSPDEALKTANESSYAQGPKQDTRILGDPVKLSLDGAPAIGPANAPLTLVEFSDFQCPYCILATPELHAVLKAYPTQVRWIFKQFPLDIHSQAALAAKAAVAAQKQAKFWEMHDALFAQKGRLSPEVIKSAAQQAGLDMARFDADLKADEVAKIVTRDSADGEQAGVMGTPTLFINGRRYNGPLTARALKPVIDSQLGIPTKAAATR